MPFTLRNIKADLEDLGSNFDGPPDLEFRAATKALELERSGLTYQRVPRRLSLSRTTAPHAQDARRRCIVVLLPRERADERFDDEIVELEELDAVRVPPGTWRGYEAGPEGLEILVIGAPNLGDAPRDDVEGRRDWWAD